MIKYLIFSPLLIAGSFLYAQPTVVKNTNTPITGTLCPIVHTTYSISNAPQGCSRQWVVVGGTIIGRSDQPTVAVSWSDTPGSKAQIKCKFTCADGTTSETPLFEELILSVKDKPWGAYGTLINVDYCTREEAFITVPRMFVQGTGGIGEPVQQEVRYEWTVPAGWQQLGTNNTGTFTTFINSITIEPINCTVPGAVQVKGLLKTYCSSSPAPASSATATITLNGVSPIATIGPQPDYTGGSACNTAPVTFFASVNVALGCITGYEWHFPASWKWRNPATGLLVASPVITTTNSIILEPDGSSAISNPIRAEVLTSCGSRIVSGNYSSPFAAPLISGSFNVCTGGTDFTLTNAGANQVEWNPTSNMVVVSGQGTATANIKAATATVRGTGTINASLPNCPVVTISGKPVWVGVPNQLVDIEKGSGAIAIGATVPFSVYDPNNMQTGPITYDWDVSGGYFAWIDLYAWTTITEPQIVLYAGTRNVCGSLGMISRGWSIDNPGGCPPGEICEMSVYPNPTTEELTISTNSPDTEMQSEINMIDSQGSVVHAIKVKGRRSVTISTIGLKKGIYYLRISRNGVTESLQIIVN